MNKLVWVQILLPCYHQWQRIDAILNGTQERYLQIFDTVDMTTSIVKQHKIEIVNDTEEPFYLVPNIPSVYYHPPRRWIGFQSVDEIRDLVNHFAIWCFQCLH